MQNKFMFMFMSYLKYFLKGLESIKEFFKIGIPIKCQYRIPLLITISHGYV